MSFRDNIAKMVQQVTSAEREIDNVVYKLDHLTADMARLVKKNAMALVPEIRQQMMANLKATGLHSPSGGLADAVANCKVIVSEKGFKIVVAQHPRQAAAQNFGWVSGKAGRKLKKLVKSGKANAAGLKSHPARKFVFLSDTQSASLQQKFDALMQADLDRAMKGS